MLDGAERAQKSERIPYLDKYVGFADFLVEILCNEKMKIDKNAKFLAKGPVAYAMLLTSQRDERTAKEFWSKVRDGSYLGHNSPEWHLRNHLLSVMVHRGYGAKAANRSAHPHEIMSRCITAWNSYRKGVTVLKVFKYNANNPVPKAA